MAKQRDRFMSGAAALGIPRRRRRNLRPDGEVRRVRIQQVALGGVCAAGLSDGLSEDALSGRVYGGAADLETSKPENVVKYIQECKEMGIRVEPPDVQVSGAQFTPHGDAIRFGLTAIKNVGGNAIESIMKARAGRGEGVHEPSGSSARRSICG
jgi:DNA polymerase-3 subunit alpha